MGGGARGGRTDGKVDGGKSYVARMRRPGGHAFWGVGASALLDVRGIHR